MSLEAALGTLRLWGLGPHVPRVYWTARGILGLWDVDCVLTPGDITQLSDQDLNDLYSAKTERGRWAAEVRCGGPILVIAGRPFIELHPLYLQSSRARRLSGIKPFMGRTKDYL